MITGSIEVHAAKNFVSIVQGDDVVMLNRAEIIEVKRFFDHEDY